MKRNRTARFFGGSTRSSRHCDLRSKALRARRFFRPLLEQFEDRRLLATVTVNTVSDVSDGTTTSIAALLTAPGADGFISLREAITAANNTANVDGPDVDSDHDPDLIAFNIAGGGVKTITPTTALPAVTQAAVIDGYTQPGASPNTLIVGSDAILLIELVGGVGPGNGLVISADNTTVRGLVINRFGSAAIHVQSGGNTIEGNWLGIEDDGNTRRANEYDVFVGNSPASAINLIGGTTPGSRNVMAGTANQNAGIMLFPGGGSATIQGNYIGMNAQGNDGIGASGRIYLGTPGNLVGGTTPGAGNVISGRAIEVFSSGNTIQGNTFGLNASGTGTLTNNLNGIFIRTHSIPTDNNLIGGTTPEARNVFATSGTTIDISNSIGPNVGNRVQGNYFGTNKAGLAPSGVINPSISGTAIRLSGGMNNLVGGTTPGAGNVIANFANGSGIEILGSNNTIQGNRIGTNAAGTAAIPNGTGIYVGNYVTNNLIGGNTAAAANVISGNYNDGILIGPAGAFTMIRGNLIGLAADGISPLGNGSAAGNPALRNGIRAEGPDNLIGGTGPGEGNTIAFNFGSGVLLPFTNVVAGAGIRNSVLGNSIHSNGGLGVDIFGGGVTVNDLNDTDAGVNDIQNFPVVSSATTAGSLTTIAGTLNSSANATFRVELFASVTADPSGFGEGQTYLGFTTVTTNGSGNGSFSFNPAVTVPVGQFITSTATNATGSTSEYSAIRVVAFVAVNQPPVITSNGAGDSASVNVPENSTTVTTVTATDPDVGTTLVYSISGGADAARFAINATSGALAFLTAPNFEAPTDADANNSYLVVVQASDGSLSDSQTLAVTVTNVNEPPAITSNGGGDSASVSVLENTTAITTVTATDPDAGTTLVYSISGGADAAQFAINPSSGALSFITAPNFEAPSDTGADNSYDVIVAASDGSLTDSQILTVTVTNANELPAITSNGSGDSASVSVPENTTAVTTVTASDPDAGTTIAYSISGGADAALFAINPSSGVLTFITAPNFEAPTDTGADNIYDVIVAASDGGASDTQAISVNVVNANEPPAITSNGGGATANISVAENTSAVTTVTATDPDAGTTLLFSLVGGADQASFTINATTGVLSFAVAPNFDTPTDADGNNSYLVIVQASDGSLTDSQALTVTVTNANEPPMITSNGGGDSASVSMLENTTAVTTVAATDPDAGTTLTYSISGGADAAQFAINPSSGALTFIAAPNFEVPTDMGADNVYDVVVSANDGSASDTQLISVSILNANESPVITSNGGGDSASVSVPENTTAVTSVSAADPDAGTTLTYSISGGSDAARFTINPSSGTLTFVAAPNFEAPTDADANNSYLVVVQASDGSLTDSQTLTVTVTNANELPTITSSGGADSASVNVPENTLAVTTITATDADAGTTLTYSISGGADAVKFAINPSSGALTFVVAPNFEAPTDADANNSYLVIVQASDGSLIDTQSLAVTVTNVNEAPVITSDGGGATAAKSVPENTTAVTTVTAVDPDLLSALVFSLAGGADAAKFTIDPNSGALAFLTPPSTQNPQDAGGDNTYDVIVQVSDGALLDTQTLAVTVTNVNEAPAITSNGGGATANISVAENTSVVTTVTASDPDAGTTLTYSISGGADAAKFTINPTSGALTFVTAPNFEAPTDADANNSYLVIVQASDGSLTDSQTLTVTVTNVNEAPVITSNGGGNSASVDLPESTTAVTTVTATDPDAGTTLTYSISGGADAAKFTIDPSSGALTFITAPNFEAPTDADANNSYLVIVQASDGSLTDSQALTVTVTNVNEAPVITSNGGGATANISVAENTSAVTTVTATDPDAGTTPTYSISGGADAAKFSINPSSGALTFITAPNFEAPTDADANNSYLVIVQASDGSLADLQTLTVTVTNVNEAPTITSNGGGTTANISVPENTTTVTTVTATDPDAGTTLTYSISGGVDAAKFTINATTGVLTFVTAPNFESPTDVGGNNVYDVNVQVSDGSLLDTQAISVTVTDVAEAAYTISGKVYKDVTGNGKSADDLPWTSSTPVTLNLYRDVNGDGVYQSGDTLLNSTVTVSGGVYNFVTPTVGKYLIKEVVPNGFVRTFPVLNDYAAVNLTGTASSGNDWYNAETCDQCAATNVSYIVNHGGVFTTITDLRGNTHEGDIVTANFTVNSTHQFTLVTYNAPGPAWDPVTASQQTVFAYHTATLTPGTHSLTVSIPKNFYQIDFVCGSYINQLGPAGSNIFYSAQNRLISADNAGVNALNSPAIDLALSTTVNNSAPLLGSNVVLTVQVSNAAGWSAATGVRVKNALPAGLTFVSSTMTQGTFNSSTGEWSLVNPLNSGATATLTITATVATAGEKKNAAQVTAAGAPDIDSTPNNDSSPSTPHNEDDDDSVSIVPQLWTKYFVVNDSSTGSTREKTFEYASDGTGVENYQLSSGNTAPRGAATTAAGNKVWVIDANKTVYVYDASGALLGSWSAGGLASNATPEGIATNGTDIWIVDAVQDKVFKYANAASRTSGSQNAASSFALNSGNRSPKDIVASSTHLWVVDDSSTDKVFKYTLAGACVGTWTIMGGGGSPTGITLDPANVNHLWIVDKSTDRVYQFNTATSRTSGSQAAASSFALGSGNTSPEGIADPPPAAQQAAANTPAKSSAQTSNPPAFDVALLTVIDEINGLLGNSRKKR